MAADLSLRMYREIKARKWVPETANMEHPVADLRDSVSCAAAKFAGALNRHEWPPSVHQCAGIIVRLKRARAHLDHALLAAEFCHDQRLADLAWLAAVCRELNQLGHECDLRLGELRARLARGFD